jgi:hypothetical protein
MGGRYRGAEDGVWSLGIVTGGRVPAVEDCPENECERCC